MARRAGLPGRRRQHRTRLIGAHEPDQLLDGGVEHRDVTVGAREDEGALDGRHGDEGEGPGPRRGSAGGGEQRRRLLPPGAEHRCCGAWFGARRGTGDGWPCRFDRAQVVVDATADAGGLACAVRSTEDLGLLTVVGIVFGEVALPVLEMYSRGITVHTSRADSRGRLPAVLELAASGAFDPLAVPTTTVPFDQAAEVWLRPVTKLVLPR